MQPFGPDNAHRPYELKHPTTSTRNTALLNANESDHAKATDEYEQPYLQDSCQRKNSTGQKVLQRPKTMPAELYTQTTTPFLQKHVPETYAKIPDSAMSEISRNSRYCYRHNPTSTCRKPKDQTKIDMMQTELDKLSDADRLAISNVWSIYAASPAAIRSLLLHGILESSCFPQLSLLSREVHEYLKIDFLAALPTEISLQILRLLDSESLCKAAQVSRQWKALADDDNVWFHLCQQHVDRRCTKCGWGLPLLERKKLRTWKRQQSLARQQSEGRGTEVADETSVAGMKRGLVLAGSSRKRNCMNGVDSASEKEPRKQFQPWKSVYQERFKIGFNWRHGRCSVKTLKVHQNGVTSLAFAEQGNTIISGSYDNTIVVSDIKTGAKIRTLTGHTLGVRCLKVSGNTVFSGGLDSLIKVWNYRTGDCLSTLCGHTGGVLSLDYDDKLKILVSGSVDHTVKVFRFDTKDTFTLRGHTDGINDVKIHRESKTVWTASDDAKIRVFDLETKTCIKVFEGHLGQVQQVHIMPPDFEPDEVSGIRDERSSDSGHTPVANEGSAGRLPAYIFSASLDNTLKLWSTASGKCIRTTFGHIAGIWSLSGDSLNLVSGSHDRTVKIWEPRSGTCQTTYGGHSGPVSAVISDDTNLVSAGEDGHIIVRSFEMEGALSTRGDILPA